MVEAEIWPGGGEIDWDLNVAQKKTELDQVATTPKAAPPTAAADDDVDFVS